MLTERNLMNTPINLKKFHKGVKKKLSSRNNPFLIDANWQQTTVLIVTYDDELRPWKRC